MLFIYIYLPIIQYFISVCIHYRCVYFFFPARDSKPFTDSTLYTEVVTDRIVNTTEVWHAHKKQKILNSVITRTTMVIFWTTERNGRYPFLCEHFIISVVLFHLGWKRGNRGYNFMDYFSQSKFSSFNTESCWQLSKNDYWLKLRYAKEMSKNFNFKYLFLNLDELEIVRQCGWICLPVQQRWTGTI